MHHAQHVLGAPILTFLREDVSKQLCIPADNIPYPRVQRASYSVQGDTAEYATMLLPEKADLYSLYVQSHAVFVRPCVEAEANTNDTTYLLQAQWFDIVTLFPANTVLRCIVYKNKAGCVLMGLYDILAFDGACMRGLAVLDRHAFIWKQCQHKQTAKIQIHWVGHEASCIRVVAQHSELPFNVRRILRIQNNAYTCVLCPLFI